MKNNFDCKYSSVGGTFCHHYDNEIIDDLDNNECNSCEMNNTCEYCSWEITHKQNCVNCIIKED